LKRYAVYYAPGPESALHRLGSGLLGRDAWSGDALPTPVFAGIAPERVAAITAEPRRYGFHATLKPPFALASGCTEAVLVRALETFAAAVAPFDAPALRLAEVGRFLALVPSAECGELTALAECAVRAFEPFRAPLSRAERARREAASLDARERELLAEWGYPYVLDRWRVHLSLTGRLEAFERDAVKAALAPVVAPLGSEPLRVEALALFVQPASDAAFRCHSRFTLAHGA
jgi:putative phosphonate metabolism protein